MKKIISILLSMVMVFSLVACGGGGEKVPNINEQINNVKTISEYSQEIPVNNMDTIKFGSYYQNNENNKESVEWIVLDKQNGKALLCSKYILDYKTISNEELNSYNNSNLRVWLNNDFYNNIFSEKEKGYICSEGDKVLLLDKMQSDKYFGSQIQDGSHWYNYKRATKGTEYAKNIEKDGNKLYVYNGNNETVVGNSGYIITDNDMIAHIDYEGAIPLLGGDNGIRPIIWVNIDAMNYVAETSNNNIRDIIGGEANIEGAEVIQNEDGSTTIGGALQYNKKNDKLLKDYNEYKQNPDDYMVKFDSNGNLWVRRWVSECMQLIYDYTILYVDGKIDSYITDFEKVGSASYDFHWMKNGNKIDESEFRQIENQFNNMADQYSSIY